jgi:hypothetical protein
MITLLLHSTTQNQFFIESEKILNDLIENRSIIDDKIEPIIRKQYNSIKFINWFKLVIDLNLYGCFLFF